MTRVTLTVPHGDMGVHAMSNAAMLSATCVRNAVLSQVELLA